METNLGKWDLGNEMREEFREVHKRERYINGDQVIQRVL